MLSTISDKSANTFTEYIKSISVRSISFNNHPVSYNTLGCVSNQLLQNRLGHLSKHAMQIILKKQPLYAVNAHSFAFCDACQCGKLHRFHFSLTKIKSRSPVELIYADLWDRHP